VPPPPATADLYRTLQRYQLLLLTAGRRLWGQMLPADFDGSWARIAPQMVAFTAGAQLASAQAAGAYVPAALDQQGIDAPPEAAVSPRVFSGVAFDGRPLDTLLEGAVRSAKGYAAAGRDGGDALALAQRWLEGALQTIVTDAARDMTAAEMAVRPKVAYVRMVNPPCCSRCAVLAGKWYSHNDILPRHRRCDCTLIPSQENVAGDFTTSAAELHKRGLITDLTADQHKRISDGADLNKVLNEGRDRWRADLALERKRAKAAAQRLQTPDGWGAGTPNPLPPGGIQDFLSHLTNRVQALNEMKAHGLVT